MRLHKRCGLHTNISNSSKASCPPVLHLLLGFGTNLVDKIENAVHMIDLKVQEKEIKKVINQFTVL